MEIKPKLQILTAESLGNTKNAVDLRLTARASLTG